MKFGKYIKKAYRSIISVLSLPPLSRGVTVARLALLCGNDTTIYGFLQRFH